MATTLQSNISAECISDDDYSIEYYDYDMVEETIVETVEDDDDEYTYEEVTVMSDIMEEKENFIDSTAAPPPVSVPDTDRESDFPSPITTNHQKPAKLTSTEVPISPATKTLSTTSGFDVFEAPELLTPSKQRAKGAGLSELSKQLRILQAKNEAQNVEVNRLERQLRILADLQNISVGDLRNALEDACKSEAFEELQNRVLKLKYELEAATLAKKPEMRKDAAAPHIANLELRIGELEEVEHKQMKEIRSLYDSLRQERAKATQFESENGQLKKALEDMIHRFQSETSRAAQAETNYQRQIHELQERQSKKMQEVAERSCNVSSSDGTQTQNNGAPSGMVSSEMAAEYQRMVKMLKLKDEELRNTKAKFHADEIRRAEALKDAEERARKVQMDMKVEADKLALTVKELEDADGQNGLRLAQFKARFAVQDERLIDMGQQLDSLYTAFDLLKEEFDSENKRHAAMLSNLNDADAEIARQTGKKEEEKNKSRRKSGHGFPPTPPHGYSSHSTVSSASLIPDYINTPTATQRRTIAPVSPATPVTATPVTNRELLSGTPYATNTTHSPYSSSNSQFLSTNDGIHGDYNDTPTSYATARAVHQSTERTPNTWELLRNNDHHNQHRTEQQYQLEDELICGYLIVESNNMLRKWKTKPCRIYMRGEGYQWQIGDKKSFPLKFGISKVEYHPNHPLSFAVSLDPTSLNAPTIRAAAVNEPDYHRWMAALYKATTGEDYQGGQDSLEVEARSPSYQTKPPPSSYRKKPPPNNDRYSHLLSGPVGRRTSAPPVMNVEESEDADLQRILELSKYDT